MDDSDFEDEERPQSTVLLAFARLTKELGTDLNPEQLRRAHPFPGNEPSAELMARVGETTGFEVRHLRIGMRGLAQLQRSVPAILLLRDGRAAVLRNLQTDKSAVNALVESVGEGAHSAAVLMDEPRLKQIWDGGVLVVKRRWRLLDKDRPFDLRWLAGLLLREARQFRDIAVAGLLMALLELVPPFSVMLMINRVLYNHSLNTLYVLSLIVLMAVAFSILFGFFRRRLTAVITARIDATLLLHVYDKMLNLPISFFEQTTTGTISSKMHELIYVRDFIADVLCGTVLDGSMLLVLIPVLLYLNWQLTLVVIAISLAVLVMYILFLPSLRDRYRAVIHAETRMNSHQVETLFGIMTVKSLSLDGLKRLQRDRHVAEVTRTRREMDYLVNWPRTLVVPPQQFMYVGSFFLGAYMVLKASPGAAVQSVGEIIAFAMIASRVTTPIIEMAELINEYEHARGAIGQVGAIINSPAEGGRSGSGLRLPMQGQVLFEKVKFRYTPTAAYALDGISFEIAKGTVFGIMGRSGSGKTTVTRLLQGLNREYEGLIKVDGMDLREIDLDHLRSSIGVVPQENFLFNGTIAENIAAARPNASMEQIVRAAQLAGAEEFIERLPNGYATQVAESARNFSGGQRQRLAIARALMIDPAILILDEATSALDAESEAIVNANLMRIAQGRTVIIISHRLSSLMKAHAILVMEQGRYYDMGRHEELIERCDIYKSLWYQQNRHLYSEAPDEVA
jgi:ATP-binding cassette subfamily B protein